MSAQVDLSWFAITVRPKQEHIAELGLRARGLDAYLPVQRFRRRWSDRMKEVDQVLFPGYVFCRFKPADKLRVLTSPGVRSIVSMGRDPHPVDESEIRSVRTLAECGRPLAAWPYIRVGQRVRIEHGPLESLRGVIVRTGDSWRVVVSVEALGCSVAVEVDADMIKPESGVYASCEA